MTTVAHPTTPVKHYAHLGDVAGIAQLINGSGYLFRPEDRSAAQLVSYTDARLVLHGYVEDEPADEEPLWKRIASPDWYNGTTKRGALVRGR